jgi:diguanylate cyclase (GGDEF)-like protein
MTSMVQATVAYKESDMLSYSNHDRIGISQGVIDLRPRLNAVLQRSLDLSELLTLFLKEIQTVVRADGCRYTNSAENISIEQGIESKHLASFRLLTNDDYLGEINFSRRSKFFDKEIKTLEALVATLIYPVRNALRYREAVRSSLTDSLTGAGNRVALESTLQRELDLVQRYKSPLSLLMIDLDRFKAINDKYGHAAGDEVLKKVVGEIRRVTRCADMTFRLGGEEFVVLLNKTDSDGAMIIAERLRAAIAGLSCVHDGQEIPVTISVGAATLAESETKETLMERADKAVYAAKEGGRNQVVQAQQLVSMDT